MFITPRRYQSSILDDVEHNIKFFSDNIQIIYNIRYIEIETIRMNNEYIFAGKFYLCTYYKYTQCIYINVYIYYYNNIIWVGTTIIYITICLFRKQKYGFVFQEQYNNNNNNNIYMS